LIDAIAVLFIGRHMRATPKVFIPRGKASHNRGRVGWRIGPSRKRGGEIGIPFRPVDGRPRQAVANACCAELSAMLRDPFASLGR
jgi:hypothetical protein